MHGPVWVSILEPPAQLLAFYSAAALVTAPDEPGQPLNCSYQQKMFNIPQVSTFDKNI